jgi:rubrerythrin
MDVTVWAQRIIDRLREHMDSERDALTEYARLAETAPDEHVRFLMGLILEDEKRHHQLFADMADSLEREIEHRAGGELPELRRTGDSAVLRAETKKLLDLERGDIRELRALRRDITKVEDTRWWSVLIDIMEADNRKHIAILEFVRDHA